MVLINEGRVDNNIMVAWMGEVYWKCLKEFLSK